MTGHKKELRLILNHFIRPFQLLFYSKKPKSKKSYKNDNIHWLQKTEESYPEKQQQAQQQQTNSNVVRNSKQYSSMPSRRRQQQQVNLNQANSVKSTRVMYNEY